MKKPIIGITLDSQQMGGYSDSPWYALRQNYCEVISEAGGIPIGLPHDAAAIEAYLDMLDGLLITGGGFDIPPNLYGEKELHETVLVNEQRTDFEWAICKGMLNYNKPILGICGGQQLLNVILGGTLIQHIPEVISNCVDHGRSDKGTIALHPVSITPGTLLHKITGVTSGVINSSHHQAVKTVASNVIVNAIAEDGVIEGIECRDYKFCLGVQWHPEYYAADFDKNLFNHFVKASL